MLFWIDLQANVEILLKTDSPSYSSSELLNDACWAKWPTIGRLCCLMSEKDKNKSETKYLNINKMLLYAHATPNYSVNLEFPMHHIEWKWSGILRHIHGLCVYFHSRFMLIYHLNGVCVCVLVAMYLLWMSVPLLECCEGWECCSWRW